MALCVPLTANNGCYLTETTKSLINFQPRTVENKRKANINIFETSSRVSSVGFSSGEASGLQPNDIFIYKNNFLHCSNFKIMIAILERGKVN